MRPPYTIEDIRQADADIWFKGKNGDYRKTFVTRAGFILWGSILCVFSFLFLYIMWLPIANSNLRIAAFIFWPLGILFSPICFLWSYYFIKNAIRK